MAWGIQVRVRISPTEYDWRWLRPSGGEPYRWETEYEAVEEADKLYPFQTGDDVRVKEFES